MPRSGSKSNGEERTYRKGTCLADHSFPDSVSLFCLYLGMFLGLISPAVVAIVTVFTSKNKALINDFKTKLVGFYRIKPRYIVIAVLVFAAIVAASIGTSVLFGGSI